MKRKNKKELMLMERIDEISEVKVQIIKAKGQVFELWEGDKVILTTISGRETAGIVCSYYIPGLIAIRPEENYTEAYSKEHIYSIEIIEHSKNKLNPLPEHNH